MKPFVLRGGVNQILPRALCPPGLLEDCYNYEVGRDFGYASIQGFEAFDGRMSPSTRDIWDLSVDNGAMLPVYSGRYFNHTPNPPRLGGAFSSDGETLIFCTATATVGRYKLITPWDISTAVLEKADGLLSGVKAIAFKPDGMKMFSVSASAALVYEKDLPAPWDPTDGLEGSPTPNLDISGVESAASGMAISEDGLTLFIIGTGSGKRLHQYTLGTAWAIDTGTFVRTVNLENRGTNPSGLAVAPGGMLAYTSDQNGDVEIYSLTTAWDASTLEYITYIDASAQDTQYDGLFLSPDGSRLVLCGKNTDNIYEYSVGPSSGENMTWSRAGKSGDLGVLISRETGPRTSALRFGYWDAQDEMPNGAVITGDSWSGTVAGGVDAALNQGKDYDFSLTLASGARGLTFKPDGLKMFVFDAAGKELYEFGLTTAWDVSSASLTDSTIVTSTQTLIMGVVAGDGLTLLCSTAPGLWVETYSFGTAWDVTALSATVARVSLSGVAGPGQIALGKDGTRLYMFSDAEIRQFNVPVAYDYTIVSEVGFKNTPPAIVGQGDIMFHSSGTRFYILGDDAVTTEYPIFYQFSCSVPWEIETASYDGVYFSTDADTTDIRSGAVKPDGDQIYVMDFTTSEIFQYRGIVERSYQPLEDIATDTEDYFDLLSEAANTLRTFITPVPGTGPVLGIKWYKDQQTAVRDLVNLNYIYDAAEPDEIPQLGQLVVARDFSTGGASDYYSAEGYVRDVRQGRILIDPLDGEDWVNPLETSGTYNSLAVMMETFFVSGSTEPSVGDVLTGQTSTKAITVYKVVVWSGSWADGDAAGVVYSAGYGGEMTAAELMDNTTTTDVDVMTFDGEIYGGKLRALSIESINPDGATMAGLYRSSRTGWQRIELGWGLRFDTGTNEPTPISSGADTSSQTVVATDWKVATLQRDLGGWAPSAGSELDAVAAAAGAFVSLVDDTQVYQNITQSDYPFAVHGFDFDLPLGARVVGIEIEITARAPSHPASPRGLNRVQPFMNNADDADGGAIEGVVSKSQAIGDLTASFVAYTFGGEASLFGAAIDREMVNDAGFGVKFHALCKPTGALLDIDHIRLRVHYVDQGSAIYFYDTVAAADYTEARLAHFILEDGAWDATGSGTMQIVDLRKKQIPTKNIQIRDAAAGAGNLIANLVGNEVALALAGKALLDDNNSKYQMIAENIYARDDLEAVYGASGAGRAFSYDGANVRHISSGITESLDKPRHIELFQFRLWLGYGWGEAAISVAGDPLSFDGSLNAVATGYGRPITGLTKLPGKTMGVFTDQATYTVTVDGADFDQQTIAPRNGAVEYSIQDVGTIPIYADPRGIARAFQSDKYGDFEATRQSHAIHPWLLDRLQSCVFDSNRRDSFVASSVARLKSQYRMYFADGFRLSMTMFGDDRPAEYTFQQLYTGSDPDQYVKVLATDADVDSAGRDRLFFTMDINPDYDHGKDLGYVYEDDRGTSFNGDSYKRWVELTPIAGSSIANNTYWAVWHLYGLAHGWASMALTTATDLAHPEDPDDSAEDSNYDIDFGSSDNAVSTGYEAYFDKDRLQQRGRHVSLRFQNESDRELSHVLQNIVLLDEKQAREEK